MYSKKKDLNKEIIKNNVWKELKKILKIKHNIKNKT